LFHKKHELPVDGEATAADFRIESADTLYLKCYDDCGNQLRWEPLVGWFGPSASVPCKENHFIDEDGYEALEGLFAQGGGVGVGVGGPWAVSKTADVPAAWAREIGVSKGVIAEWFAKE
jgi:hypothetical protein